MKFKSILFLVLIVVAGYSIYTNFGPANRTSTEVLESYLKNWKNDHSSVIYPMLSSRAKSQLRKQNINNNADYYVNFTQNRSDLFSWTLTSQQVGANTARFGFDLQFRELSGRRYTESAMFHLVKESDGWYVDSWQKDGGYILP